MKNKKIMSLVLATTLAGSLLAGCGGNETNTGADAGELTNDVKATLKIACFSPDDSEYYASKGLEEAFQKKYPNVTIEVEEYKDTTEYQNAMKVRISGNELPDIMYLQPDMINTYQNYLTDLSELPVAADNIYSEEYKVDGKLYALPTSSGETYVYYWKELFDKANLEVPDTWDEFSDVCKKLQEYGTKEDPNFVALGIGAKDEWPTYTFMEYMPALVSGNGSYWTKMATMDEPFKQDTDIYKAYKKVYDLFSSGVCGQNALGVGHDQFAALFQQKKVGMMVFAPSLYAAIKDAGVDVSDLSSFYLPTRESEDDEFRTLVAGNNMLAVTKDSKNVALAKEFINFFFSKEWYSDFINNKYDGTALKSIQKTKEPTMQAADDLQKEVTPVCYLGGDKNFTDIVGQTKFDYKKLGAQFFVKDFDFEKAMNELNANWKSARSSLGIK